MIVAGPGHAAVLAAIHAAAFPPEEAWDAASFAQLLVTPGTFGLIAAERGVALLRVAGDEAELLTLAVLPACRRQGIGSALLDAAAAEASRRGAAVLFLEVSVANDPAQLLYARFGFAEVGRRRRYYGDGEDARVLRLVLGGAARACQ